MEALTFIPVQTLLQTKKRAVTLHCSVRWTLLLLEELNNNSCAVHMSSGMVTHMREILQGATGTYVLLFCWRALYIIQSSHS